MYRSKKKRNIIIVSLVGVLLCMAVGYAAFNTELKISGTSKVTSNWDIEITNVTNGKPVGSAENTVAPTWDALTASMEADLYEKGDAMEYDVTIENKGTIDAKLNDVLTNIENANSEAVNITFSGYTKGEILKAGSIKVVHVKIEYNPNYDGGETSSEVEINFDYTQENKDPEAPKSYLLTYDYSSNGGTNVDIKEEYVLSKDKVNLNNKAYKEGYTFIGWNIDKDAKEALTEYEMPESSVTLYAIYSKEIKVTYIVGSNITNIEKTNDKCSMYNNETTCEITLPNITPNSGYMIDGWYNGETKVGNPNDKYKINNDITLSSKVIEDVVTLSISTTSTTNSITVVASGSATSGIAKYEYSKDGGKSWITGTGNTHTFTGLTQGTNYNIVVRIASNAGKLASQTKATTTSTISKPTFSESGTSPKTVTINYPSGCGSTLTCTYQKSNGSKVTVRSSTATVTFTNDGTLVATVSDGINETSSTYTVTIPAIIQSWTSSSKTDFHNSTYKSNIITATFLDNKDVPSNAVASWDVSAYKNRSVMAWVIADTTDTTKYHLYIGGDGGVIANENSSNIFSGFKKLQQITFENNFNTSNVTDMSYMFYHCYQLTSLDVSNWDTSSVINMSHMFDSCELTGLDVSKWNTSNVIDMSYMFQGCDSLTSLDVSKWNTSNVIDMSYMFRGCASLTSLDVSKWDTSNVTDMSYMFQNCHDITSLDVSKWDTSSVDTMKRMFDNCSSLINLNVSDWNTSNVIDMIYMFQGCASLTSLDVSKWDTSNVTDMSAMFWNCTSLTSIDVNDWDTSNVTDMSGMFEACTKLISLDASNWNTSSVTDMAEMFNDCTSLTTVNIGNWNTSNVKSMNGMFWDCSRLTQLNLCNWDTNKVTNMFHMFYNTSNLRSIYVGSNWTTANASSTTDMFTGSRVSSVTTGRC